MVGDKLSSGSNLCVFAPLRETFLFWPKPIRSPKRFCVSRKGAETLRKTACEGNCGSLHNDADGSERFRPLRANARFGLRQWEM
jgi:hypothetical protein